MKLKQQISKFSGISIISNYESIDLSITRRFNLLRYFALLARLYESCFFFFSFFFFIVTIRIMIKLTSVSVFNFFIVLSEIFS